MCIVTADAVQTLVSVNNMDQSVFRDGDKTILASSWHKVFKNCSPTEEIYNAIASKSGAHSPECANVSKEWLLLFLMIYIHATEQNVLLFRTTF